MENIVTLFMGYNILVMKKRKETAKQIILGSSVIY